MLPPIGTEAEAEVTTEGAAAKTRVPTLDESFSEFESLGDVTVTIFS
jgi:hypothetical protein